MVSIHVLSRSTVNRIGSSQVLVDPGCVVKELVDNAIDSRATSISIEISMNTLDVIQVRDNGRGIAPEDRILVCRRHCTSKIRDYNDIRMLAGSTLGFRGEALSSLAELAHGLSITTRVEGEATGVKLMIGTKGDILGKEPASHPVGTTVRASDFFHDYPVRKQHASKAATKCLAKIKRTVQAYALARPNTRFSLRILKAKNEKGDFIYSPKVGNGNTPDAASKVMGRECASQCSWSIVNAGGYAMQAFAPRADADAARIANTGQFISVDFRPVSASRGVLKQVISLFKEKLKKSNKSLEAVKDPFLFLNISCPPASYDPTVEPAKDDVLFDDNSQVLKAVEELFMSCYPPAEMKLPPAADIAPQTGNAIESTPREQPPAEILPPSTSDCNGLCKHPRPLSTSPDILEDDELQLLESRVSLANPGQPTMYNLNDDVDDVMQDSVPSANDNENEESNELKQCANLSNPWTIARLATTIRTKPVPLNGFSHNRTTPPPIPLKPQSESFINSGICTVPKSVNSASRANDQPFGRSGRAQRLTRASRLNSGSLSVLCQNYMPTPVPSSSPTHGVSLSLEAIPEAGMVRRRNKPRGQASNRTSNSPHLRNANWFSFEAPKEKQHLQHRDIREMFKSTVAATQTRAVERNLGLVTRGEPPDTFPSSPVHEGTSTVAQSALEIADELPSSTPAVGSTRSSETMLFDRTWPTVDGIDFPGDSDAGPATSIEPAPKRHRTAEGRSLMTSCLPTKHIAEYSQLQSLVHIVSLDASQLRAALPNLDYFTNFIPWSNPPSELFCTFHLPFNDQELEIYCAKLHDLLKMWKPDGIIGDVRSVVLRALSAMG